MCHDPHSQPGERDGRRQLPRFRLRPRPSRPHPLRRLIEGRLTQEEHAERIDAVYTAKTVGELAPLTGDLPDKGSPGGTPRTGPAAFCAADRELLGTGTGFENITAVVGVAERQGRWLAEPRTNVSAVSGHVTLDLREAVMAQREVTVQCALFCSGMRLIVPPGVRVTNRTSGILGNVDLQGYTAPADIGAPTVHLTGVCVLSGVDVQTRPSGPRP
ncbi:DUF1707 SHOCT-like domain-containing protein [Allosalinactinospora lopnorensis]|uniref:DUF1707 SHOCT-like domain-containing protein n=1 Tax=Allosalinactinospora lopnorensis TaxID=1352348 RepID=UPI00308442BA